MLDFSRNHFELFGLPQGFALDPALLGERFRALQAAVHPDRFASAPDQERRLSMQASTRVNEAFQTLKHPLSRALYLLSLYPAPAPDAIPQDSEFLMEQMELRETLAEATATRDPPAAVGTVLAHIAQSERSIVAGLAQLFSDPSQIPAAHAAVRKLQFLDKCRRDAEALETELDLGV